MPLYAASAVLTLGEGAVAVLVPPYLDARGIGAGVIGAILAVYGVAALLARLPAAAWYRARRATALVSGGCLLMALSFLLLPLTSTPVGVALLVGLDGIGFAIATTAALAALMDRRHPDTNAGSIMGWYTGSLGLGYAAAGFVAGGVAEATNVSTAILVLAAVPAVAALLLAVALRAAPPLAAAAATIEPPSGTRRRLGALRSAPPTVWLAFLVCLHVSLVHGVLSAFFPLYGLDIGLTIGQIGAMLGVHGLAAAGIRFLAGPLFRLLPYRAALPSMILLNSGAVASMALTSVYPVLLASWGVVGLSRGVLRVASGALVLDEAGSTDAQRGAASGIYLAGLDVGKVAGPVVGGVFAELIGFRGAFLAVSVAFPIAYFLLARRVSSSPAPAPGVVT